MGWGCRRQGADGNGFGAKGDGENYIMTSFIISTPTKIFLG
jgi:hypothetical protein